MPWKVTKTFTIKNDCHSTNVTENFKEQTTTNQKDSSCVRYSKAIATRRFNPCEWSQKTESQVLLSWKKNIFAWSKVNTLTAAHGVLITVRIRRTISPGQCGCSVHLLRPHQHGITDNSSSMGNKTVEKLQRELRSHLTVANVRVVPTVGQQYFS